MELFELTIITDIIQNTSIIGWFLLESHLLLIIIILLRDNLLLLFLLFLGEFFHMKACDSNMRVNSSIKVSK